MEKGLLSWPFSILSSLLTKKLLRNLSEPHFLVSAPCVTEPDGIVGGISISTIHDQFSNQCSRGCCCWCTDCQGWNIKLYTILVFISRLIISTPFHFHTYCYYISVAIQEKLARKIYRLIRDDCGQRCRYLWKHFSSFFIVVICSWSTNHHNNQLSVLSHLFGITGKTK